MRDIRAILTESATQPKEIQNYIKSWLKQPSSEKEMHDILSAIVEGAKEAYDYRSEDGYDTGDRNYDKATSVLKNFLDGIEE